MKCIMVEVQHNSIHYVKYLSFETFGWVEPYIFLYMYYFYCFTKQFGYYCMTFQLHYLYFFFFRMIKDHYLSIIYSCYLHSANIFHNVCL